MNELFGTILGALVVIAALGVLTIGSKFIKFVAQKVSDLFD